MNGDSTDKGKAKAKAGKSEDEVSTAKQPKELSLGNRIVESAKGLLKDAVSSGPDAAQSMSSSVLGSKISASESSKDGSEVANLLAPRSSKPLAAGTNTQSSGAIEGSFKTASGDVQIAEQFDAFSAGNAFQAVHHAAKSSTFEDSRNSAMMDQSSNTSNTHALYTAANDDGAEVRALLADPNFSADMDVSMSGFQEAPEQSIDDLFSQKFSTAEQDAITRIRKSLPPPPVHRSMPRDHPL